MLDCFEFGKAVVKMEHKGLLEEIYDKAVNGSDWMKAAEHEINRQLDDALSIYRQKLPEQTFTELREIVVGGTVIAEKVSFLAGIRYGMRLLMEGSSCEMPGIMEIKADFDKQE